MSQLRGVQSGRKAGERTRRALIRAGRRLFTQHGYDGASVRAITRAANANLGAVTYHFGSKRKLYGEVVASVLTPLAERVERAAAGDGDALERVEAVMRVFFAFLAESPEMPRLMHQELTVGREPPEEAVRVVRRLVQALRGVVAEGQAQGLIGPGDPSLYALSIVSQPLQAAIARPMLSKVAGLNLKDEATRGRLVDHALAFARRALEAKRGKERR